MLVTLFVALYFSHLEELVLVVGLALAVVAEDVVEHLSVPYTLHIRYTTGLCEAPARVGVRPLQMIRIFDIILSLPPHRPSGFEIRF